MLCFSLAETDVAALYEQGKAADYFLKAVELGEAEESQANFDKMVEESKIPMDYVPKDI